MTQKDWKEALNEAIKQAYQSGYKDGYNDAEWKMKEERERIKKLEEPWEA